MPCRTLLPKSWTASPGSRPTARINGVLVQEMIAVGTEAIVGLSRHDPFGMAVVVGAGGVLVELLRDSALALAPIDEARAAALIGETRFGAMLAGYRGARPGDARALAALVARSLQHRRAIRRLARSHRSQSRSCRRRRRGRARSRRAHRAAQSFSPTEDREFHGLRQHRSDAREDHRDDHHEPAGQDEYPVRRAAYRSAGRLRGTGERYDDPRRHPDRRRARLLRRLRHQPANAALLQRRRLAGACEARQRHLHENLELAPADDRGRQRLLPRRRMRPVDGVRLHARRRKRRVWRAGNPVSILAALRHHALGAADEANQRAAADGHRASAPRRRSGSVSSTASCRTRN